MTADRSGESRLPVLLLAGFLGSGKTTLLNRLLTDPRGRGLAVIVNEFGAVPIDGKLVVGAEEDIVLLQNGCVCCTVRGDLVETIGRLLARRERRFRRLDFERLVIEASGLASPGPVLQTLAIEDRLSSSTYAQGVVTLCNAERISDQLAQHPEAQDQVGYADLLLLNHTDRVSEAEREAALASVREINPLVPIEVCEHAQVDPELVLGVVQEPRPRLTAGTATIDSARHTPEVGTLSLTADAPLDLHRLKMWLRLLGAKRDHELLRVKGWLRCSGRPEAVVVQGVYQWLEIGPGSGPPPESSALVLIGRHLDEEELRAGWRACVAS